MQGFRGLEHTYAGVQRTGTHSCRVQRTGTHSARVQRTGTHSCSGVEDRHTLMQMFRGLEHTYAGVQRTGTHSCRVQRTGTQSARVKRTGTHSARVQRLGMVSKIQAQKKYCTLQNNKFLEQINIHFPPRNS